MDEKREHKVMSFQGIEPLIWKNMIMNLNAEKR